MEGGEIIVKSAKLTKKEKAIEKMLISGEYQSVGLREFDAIVQAVERKKKDAVLNMRVNSHDLNRLKQKAKKLGIPYQTLISEILHRFAA